LILRLKQRIEPIDEIRENDVVEYEEERGKKGMNAVNVEVLN